MYVYVSESLSIFHSKKQQQMLLIFLFLSFATCKFSKIRKQIWPTREKNQTQSEKASEECCFL